MAIKVGTPGAAELKDFIRDIPDFPKPGILFRDITPLLQDPAALSLAVEFMTHTFRSQHIDIVVGAESRGFIFGTAVARNLTAGFVPIRKPGKLPGPKISLSYELEYGLDTLEIHADSIKPGQRVLMVDDLLATGGTMRACCDLVEKLGGQIIGISFLIELLGLQGRERLSRWATYSVLSYE
jgi:adenine phosphoribosyltransferase